MSDLPFTARLCRVCGACFHVGHARHDDKGNQFKCSLDFHCGKPTIPCPSFDLEWEDRHKALRDWAAVNVAGRTAESSDPAWWSA